MGIPMCVIVTQLWVFGCFAVYLFVFYDELLKRVNTVVFVFLGDVVDVSGLMWFHNYALRELLC